jgi:UDPglucose 6-dehydrogenase
MQNFRLLFGERVSYFDNEFETLEGVDALIIATEWNEYRNLDLVRAKSAMRGDVLLDARNVLDHEAAQEAGFQYAGVGR